MLNVRAAILLANVVQTREKQTDLQDFPPQPPRLREQPPPLYSPSTPRLRLPPTVCPTPHAPLPHPAAIQAAETPSLLPLTGPHLRPLHPPRSLHINPLSLVYPPSHPPSQGGVPPLVWRVLRLPPHQPPLQRHFQAVQVVLRQRRGGQDAGQGPEHEQRQGGGRKGAPRGGGPGGQACRRLQGCQQH